MRQKRDSDVKEPTTLSTDDFWKELRKGVQAILTERGWTIDNARHRGVAFQLWMANLIHGYESGYDDEPEDACLTSNDLKVDLFFEDAARSHLLLAQCKYSKRDALVDETEVCDFFARHDRLMDRRWVTEHAPPNVYELLGAYPDRLEHGYSVTYYFVTTASATDRIRQAVDSINADSIARDLRVSCELFDFSKLKDYYVRSRTVEVSVPGEVRFRLPTGKFFRKDAPYQTLVAVVKGNELANLYRQKKESLYAWNIRGYLGNRGINRDIAATARDKPEDFFYFNNGIAAICTDFDIVDNNQLVAKNFQIINGAQTLTSLARGRADAGLEVLFRLTRTSNVKTEKGINRDMIRFNNSQNVIRVSDFRSNDPIQLSLERAFRESKARGPLPVISYLRKRGPSPRGLGLSIRLEDLAKIRYSFLYEPTLVFASPKALWSQEDDGGAYEKAFGVDGVLRDEWPGDVFVEALVAIAFFRAADESTKTVASARPEMRYLRRLKFHIVALAGLFVRARYPEKAHTLIATTKGFEEAWASFWPEAARVVDDVHSNAEEVGGTLFAFVRSDERWNQMRKRLERHLTIAAI